MRNTAKNEMGPQSRFMDEDVPLKIEQVAKACSAVKNRSQTTLVVLRLWYITWTVKGNVTWRGLPMDMPTYSL